MSCIINVLIRLIPAGTCRYLHYALLEMRLMVYTIYVDAYVKKPLACNICVQKEFSFLYKLNNKNKRREDTVILSFHQQKTCTFYLLVGPYLYIFALTK